MLRVVFVVFLTIAWSACGSDDTGNLCQFDTADGFDTSECVIDANASSVVLNEFSSTGDDEVELFNTASTAVSLGGWILTDDIEPQRVDTYDPLADTEKFVFSEATVIPAGGYLVIPKGAAELTHAFGISSKGDIVSLVAPNGTLIDQGQAAKNMAKPSYCRVPDGTGDWQTCEKTMGSSNEAVKCGNGVLDASEECDNTDFGDASCEAIADVFTGGSLSCSKACTIDVSSCESNAACDADKLVLNEVCHKNADCGVSDVTLGDWLEIYNPSDSSADLSGCFIQVSDGGAVKLETQIAWVRGYESLTLEAGGYWVVDDVEALFDAGDNELVYLLNRDREAINGLTTSSALSVDGDSESSACAIDEDPATPTPGSANSCGL
jgi:hypothetical protein